MKRMFAGFLMGALFLGGVMFFYSAKSTNTKSKVGYLNTNELWSKMPEKAQADTTIEQMKNEFIVYLQKKQMNFENQVIEFRKDSASLSELIRKERVNELIKEQESIQKFPEQAEQELIKKREELYDPIREKMQKAIDDVAMEQGYDYVIDASFGNIVFARNKEDNVMALVESKLGLK